MKVIFVCSKEKYEDNDAIIAYQLIAKVAKKTNALVVLSIKYEVERHIAKEVLRCYYKVVSIFDSYFKYIDTNIDIQEFLNHHKEVDGIVIIGDNKTRLNYVFSKYFIDSTDFIKNIPWYKKLSLPWIFGLRRKTKDSCNVLNISYKNLMSNQIEGNMRKRF